MAPSTRMVSPVKALKDNVATRMSSLGIGRGSGRSRQSTEEDLTGHDVMPCDADSNNPLFQGVCIVGNGRSVLSQSAGPAVDKFETVLRFNEFQTSGFEKHVGTKTSVWVLSDWTIVKLINKYPDRSMPVLCAVPYRFMGKPYYATRRAEVEAQLTPAQRKRVSFIAMETARELIEGRNFGDRWPSSGLLTIMHMLSAQEHKRVYVHGFDFFKEIDGKIHYMEDTHTANHHAAEEERICSEFMRQGRVKFVA